MSASGTRRCTISDRRRHRGARAVARSAGARSWLRRGAGGGAGRGKMRAALPRRRGAAGACARLPSASAPATRSRCWRRRRRAAARWLARPRGREFAAAVPLGRRAAGPAAAVAQRSSRPGGRLVLADVIPPGLSPAADAKALLGFAWQGGFLRPRPPRPRPHGAVGLPPRPQRARARNLCASRR